MKALSSKISELELEVQNHFWHEDERDDCTETILSPIAKVWWLGATPC
jgi:hypothetical protein